MSLLDLPIPPKPAAFTPEGAPPGVALRLDVYGKWPASRQKIKPRLGIVHTNGASVEASVQSSINYGNAAAANTKPHYLVGDKPAKVLATNLRGIANATGADIEAQYNEVDCALWSYAIETADMGSKRALATGVKWAGDCGPFLPRPGDQPDDAEIVARILAYESIVWNHPLGVPPTWNHSAGGVVAHTIPYPYPHYTIQRGKTCPGSTKASQLFDEILPRARQIRAAWLDDTPPPPEEEPIVVRYFKLAETDKTVWATSDGLVAVRLEAHQALGRGVDLGNLAILPAAERDDYVFVPGFTSESVK